MQTQDIVTAVSPEKARELLPMPYKHVGLTVQGVDATRLTPYPNPLVSVPEEVGRAIALRNVAKRFIESRIAIAMVGLGLRPAARTVSGHVQAAIFFAGLARKVASSPDPQPTLTPTAAPPSNTEGVEPAGMRGSDKAVYWVDEAEKLEVDLDPNVQTSTTEEHARRVMADVERGLAYIRGHEVEL